MGIRSGKSKSLVTANSSVADTRCPCSPLPKSESRTSWNYNLTSYEAKRLLNLAEEPGLEQEAAMSENRMTVVTETTWKSSNPTNPPSAPITRANSDVSLYMPIRRRSMIQTPGVATRSTPARDIPPVPQLNFRHSHPPTPSLSRQQSVESYRSGVMSMPPPAQDSELRAVTPCEDKYLSIGAFKLGSLRITNGSPSPVTPDIDRARASKGLGAGHAITREGYFSGAQAPEIGVNTAETQGSSQPPRFLPEITQSPISQPQPTSPALQTTSKLTALEDLLFEDEAQPEYSSIEVLDVRLDPNAKPPHAESERDAGVGVARTDSGFVSTASPASEASHKPLAKADSGYSSNVSLRSFQAKPRVPEHQSTAAPVERQTPGRESSPPPVPPKDPSRNSRNSWIPQGRRDSVANKSASMRLAEESRATRQPLNPIVTHVSGEREPASPARELRSPRSVKSSESDHSGSALSIGGGTQKRSRLQRFLSGARRPAATPLAVHPTHALGQSSIPPVPQDIERKLQEHSGGRFPSTAKKLALKSRSSMDTLKTIFSVGSFEASQDAGYYMPNARTVTEPESKDWKQTLTSVPASFSNAAAHVMPRRSVSRKPVPVRQVSTTGSDGNGVRGGLSPVDATSPIRSPKSSGRTMSLTFFAERGLKPRHRASDLDLARSSGGLPSPALPSPVAKAMSVESTNKTSQSANTTRRPQSLRVPPPLSMASLSRRTSRESLHNLANKTSMDSIRSHTSTQPGTGNSLGHSRSNSGITMDPRRLQAFRQSHNPQSPSYNSPTSGPVTDQGSRRNSISSIHTEGAGGFVPGSARVWPVHTPQQQPLRHRASYDGYSYQHQQLRGHAPSMSNGYTAPAKPLAYDLRHSNSRGQLDAAATWSRSQADAAAGQWYQAGPPHVPRVAHHRNRSMGNRNGHGHGQNVPYRVLHSYNSPAYRHAPIWG